VMQPFRNIRQRLLFTVAFFHGTSGLVTSLKSRLSGLALPHVYNPYFLSVKDSLAYEH